MSWFNKIMMRINSVISKHASRYIRKNTINAKYSKNKDLALVSGLALGVQLMRLPSWQVSDIGITTACATLAIKGFCEAIKNKFALKPIKKRAMDIKKRDK